jgi:hypothetical protein
MKDLKNVNEPENGSQETQNDVSEPVNGSQETQNGSGKSSYESLAEQLYSNHKAVELSLVDEALQGPLAEYGYEASRIETGRDLIKTAEQAFHQQQSAYEKRLNATRDFQNAREKAEDYYIHMVKIARVAFADDKSAWTELHLDGKRSRVFGIWIQETAHFFDNALNSQEIMDALAGFNVTAEALQEGKDLVEDARTKEIRRQRAMGDSQRATELRDDAFAAMNKWVGDFLKIARLAFDTDRQQLEKLGIVA